MKQYEYQEALDFFVIGHTFTEDEIEDMYEMRYRLAELIDKLPYWLELEERDKSMKPLYIGNMVLCGKCYRNTIYSHLTNNKNYRCDSECGQVVDWSSENE